MRRGEAFPSSYVSKEDVMTPVVATIASVALGAVKGEHGEEQKPVMHFSHPREWKALIVNGVNWSICEEAFGPESDEWRGKRVELYHDPNVMFGNKKVGGVRVRIVAQGNGLTAHGVAMWTLTQAKAKCAEHGISEADLMAHLRSGGLTQYIPNQHTALVQALIVSRTQVGESLDDGVGEPLAPPPPMGRSDEIPFAWLLPLAMASLGLLGIA